MKLYIYDPKLNMICKLSFPKDNEQKPYIPNNSTSACHLY